MTRYLSRRIGEAALALWGVLTIIFFVTRLLGDPVTLMLPIGATEEQMQTLRISLGLDKPLVVQYLIYLGDVLRGDFGYSYVFNRPALEVVLERMPATIELSAVALVLGIALGGIAGVVAALKRGSLVEFIVMVAALLGQATPVFWLGLIMIMVFSVKLGWLPTGGYGTAAHVVLPAIALAIFISSSIARLLRSSMLDTMKEDYVRTANAKGLMPRTVLMWHTLRNALIPVVTMIGILVGELLGGAVVTETVFSWPGVGRLLFQAIETKDFPVIQAGVLLVAAIFILINFLVDLLYAVLDPRIQNNRS